MKIMYTILFFTDTMLLILLSFLFLHSLDNGTAHGTLALLLTGIVLCISFLVFFLHRYTRIPPTNSEKQF
jgi:predicted neutral ceramidase superfamily lipid hydrolase